MRPGAGAGRPCSHYTSPGSCGGSRSCPPRNYDELVTDGEIFSCLSAPRGQNQRASDNTCGRVDAALSCRAIIHLETVMSALGAVFRRHSRACRPPSGLGLARSTPQGSCGVGLAQPDRLGNILIPVSSDGGSKQGLRRPPSTGRRQGQRRVATGLVQSGREPSVCLGNSPRASSGPTPSE